MNGVFTPQTWLMIVIAVASAAFFGGSMSTSNEKYVTRNEYLANAERIHEQMVDLKGQLTALDLYVRNNLPERKSR